MSSLSKRPSSSQPVLGTLVIACLFACACGATPDESSDGFSGSNGVGTGGGSVAGASGFGNGSAASASTGGAVAVAGSFGTSGSAGTAGGLASGGAGEAVGIGGSGGSWAGAAGAGSVGGQGTGGEGHGGAGGVGGGTGGMGGGAVTFTELYSQYFNNKQFASNCTGSACHNPGTQKGIDFSTQAKGYTSVKNSLSRVISQISSGSMPQTRPKWTTAELALVKAWQAEGAPNN